MKLYTNSGKQWSFGICPKKMPALFSDKFNLVDSFKAIRLHEDQLEDGVQIFFAVNLKVTLRDLSRSVFVFQEGIFNLKR